MMVARLCGSALALLSAGFALLFLSLPSASAYPVLGPTALATLQELEWRHGEVSWPMPAKRPKLADGEWRIEAFYRALDIRTARPEHGPLRNVTLRTKAPHAPLGLLLGRPVATDELLAATYGTPDFEVVEWARDESGSSNGSSSGFGSSIIGGGGGAVLRAATSGVAALGFQLVAALQANGVRLSSGPGDEVGRLLRLFHGAGRSRQVAHALDLDVRFGPFLNKKVRGRNVLGLRDPLATPSGTMYYRAPTHALLRSEAANRTVAGGERGNGVRLAAPSANAAHAAWRVGLQHCPGRVASYSGAFLVTRSHFLKVDYSIKSHLEGVSMNTFGAADYAMKTSVS
jgi:hypothetical protein